MSPNLKRLLRKHRTSTVSRQSNLGMREQYGRSWPFDVHIPFDLPPLLNLPIRVHLPPLFNLQTPVDTHIFQSPGGSIIKAS